MNPGCHQCWNGKQRLMFIWASLTFSSTWILYFLQGMLVLIITWKMIKVSPKIFSFVIPASSWSDHGFGFSFVLTPFSFVFCIFILYFVFLFCILYFSFVFYISDLYFVFHHLYFVFLFCISSNAGEANSWHNLPLMVNWLKGLHLTSMKRGV